MREILKQYIPLADMILDNEFFESKTMTEFKPALSMEEFYGNCSKLIKIIKGENLIQEHDKIETNDNETLQMNQNNYANPEGLQKMFQPELIQVYKIQKILNKVKLQNHEKELSDFANFLGNKSLGSEIYLSVNMLH